MDYAKPFRYILEIAKCQSISLAAENLNIHQPTLSKYLKKVESEFGAELFDRSTTPLRLTDVGHCYIRTARKILDIDHQLQKELSELQGELPCLKIGISPSRAPYLLPIIQKDFLQTCPRAGVSIHEGSTEELNAGLSNGALDLIISLKGEGTDGFESKKLFNETIFLAVPETYAGEDIYRALQEFCLISSGKGQLSSHFSALLPKAPAAIECQNIITALALVKAGIGVSFVPSYMADYGDLQAIRFLRLPPEAQADKLREVCIFYRKEQFLTATEKAFIASAENTTQQSRQTL